MASSATISSYGPFSKCLIFRNRFGIQYAGCLLLSASGCDEHPRKVSKFAAVSTAHTLTARASSCTTAEANGVISIHTFWSGWASLRGVPPIWSRQLPARGVFLRFLVQNIFKQFGLALGPAIGTYSVRIRTGAHTCGLSPRFAHTPATGSFAHRSPAAVSGALPVPRRFLWRGGRGAIAPAAAVLLIRPGKAGDRAKRAVRKTAAAGGKSRRPVGALVTRQLKFSEPSGPLTRSTRCRNDSYSHSYRRPSWTKQMGMLQLALRVATTDQRARSIANGIPASPPSECGTPFLTRLDNLPRAGRFYFV